MHCKKRAAEFDKAFIMLFARLVLKRGETMRTVSGAMRALEDARAGRRKSIDRVRVPAIIRNYRAPE